MGNFLRRHRLIASAGVALAVLAPAAVMAQPASAFPKGDSVLAFSYKIKASTTIKKLNQTINTPNGTFKGEIDIDQEKLTGSIKLPPASFTTTEAGVGLLTATAQIVQAKPVTGTIDLSTFKVKATSVFNIRILTAYAAGVPVNLVGNNCTTATPVTVTMAGIAKLAGTSKFSGTYTIPKFKTCSVMTAVLNQLIPGPGNTFTATASS